MVVDCLALKIPRGHSHKEARHTNDQFEVHPRTYKCHHPLQELQLAQTEINHKHVEIKSLFI